MAVLIIAPERDEHAVAVGDELRRRGAAFKVLDVGDFPDRTRLTMRYECCTGRRAFCLEDGAGRIDLAAFGAVWWRRPSHPSLSPAMASPSHRQFAANEAQEALNGLWHALDAGWVNEPARDAVAHRKAYQLCVAQDVGFTIPSTLITSDPFEARKFVDARGYRNVVYKSFSSTTEEWRETRLLKPEEIELLGHVRHAPVIFQGYVEAVYDLRISIVGDRIFPAAIYSQETAYTVDSRIDIGSARIEAVSLPAEVEARLLALMQRLGLVYGAVDMRLKPDGEYVFLEINPAGQFYYIEAACGLPIAAAMAEALIARDRTSAGPPRETVADLEAAGCDHEVTAHEPAAAAPAHQALHSTG